MQDWTIAETMLRLGEMIKAETKDGLSFVGEVVALTPSAARVKMPDGKLAFLPAFPSLEDKIYRLAMP